MSNGLISRLRESNQMLLDALKSKGLIVSDSETGSKGAAFLSFVNSSCPLSSSEESQ